MKRLFAILLLAALTACGALGIAPPKTFLEQAAAAQVTVTGVRSSALNLLNAGEITAAQAKSARAAADAGNQAIDIALDAYVIACPQPVAAPAAAASAPPPAANCAVPAATAKLDAAVAILTAAQTILLSYKGK